MCLSSTVLGKCSMVLDVTSFVSNVEIILEYCTRFAGAVSKCLIKAWTVRNKLMKFLG